MNDDFEESLRETLGKAVPTPPESQSWAAGARAYTHRVRRTRAVVAIGAVAVVAAAAIVVPSVLANGGDHVAGPADSTTGPKSPVPIPPLTHPFTCAMSGLIHNESPIPNGVVAMGAVLARLCPVSPQSWTPPSGALVTDVDGLVGTLNALRQLPKGAVYHCPVQLVDQPSYSLTFQYDDGHTASVTGSTGGCTFIKAGHVGREGSIPLLLSYLNRLHDQRARYSPPPQQTTTLGCPANPDESQAVLVDGRGPGLTRAMACSYVLLASGRPSGIGALSTQQVEEINADLAAHATRKPADTPTIRTCQARRGGGVLRSIIGENSWGDRIQLTAQCSVYSFMDRNGTWYWTPMQQTSTMLQSVLHATGQVSGRLLGVGGPIHSPYPWAGTVYLSRPGSKFVLTVGPDGIFGAQVDVGRYRVIGYSPLYLDGKTPCHPAQPFVNVRAHQTVHVNVLCQMK